ncbi:hypothetical protein ACIQWZ_12465 [Streptomyces sp. NPDC098077]|uniref:hypothetical protein n=1 Tax=Streptomyces sp. NPDC098077 TaxID=3366093 RepID=UPI0038241B6A
MRITLMTPDERAVIAARLDGQNPAAPELVDATVAAAAGVARSGYSVAAVGRLLAADMLAVAARLVQAEQTLTVTRETLARLAATGDDYDLSEVLYELERAGAGLRRAELDHAEHVLDAVARAGAF